MSETVQTWEVLVDDGQTLQRREVRAKSYEHDDAEAWLPDAPNVRDGAPSLRAAVTKVAAHESWPVVAILDPAQRVAAQTRSDNTVVELVRSSTPDALTDAAERTYQELCALQDRREGPFSREEKDTLGRAITAVLERHALARVVSDLALTSPCDPTPQKGNR